MICIQIQYKKSGLDMVTNVTVVLYRLKNVQGWGVASPFIFIALAR